MHIRLDFILFKKTHISNQSSLTKSFTYLWKWFYDNHIVLNLGIIMTCFWFEYHQELIFPGRCHNCTFCRRVCSITNNNRSCLTCCSHLKQLCKNVANKLNALTRSTPYLNHNQRRLIYGSFFTGQLSYYGPSAPENQVIP